MPTLFKTFHSMLSGFMGIAITLAFFLPAGSVSALGATSQDLPLHFLRSADCTGEVVDVSGTIHTVNQTQADGSVIGHFNYQDVRGIGLTSGNTYQVTAVDHIRLRAPFPSSITSVQSLRLISRGSSSNLLIHVIYHITINSNGEMSAFVEDLDMKCT